MNHPLFHSDAPDIPGVDPVSSAAFMAFKRSMILHRRLLTVMFADQEMHPAQAGCLRALSERNGMSQSDLADALHVSRPTVTTMLQRMEAIGTIERSADETDSRITRVYLTAKGQRIAEHLRTVFTEMLDVSVGQLPASDRAELTRILGDLNAHVEVALAQRGASTSAWHHPLVDEGEEAR